MASLPVRGLYSMFNAVFSTVYPIHEENFCPGLAEERGLPVLRRLQADRSVPPRPALLISRRAEGAATVDTRGWIGGASRREILSIKPETFLCAVLETLFNNPRSFSPQVE